MSENKPTLGNGKICYIEIPATDFNASANFYKEAFGWNVRTRGEGQLAFDDGVGQVSGTWVLNRKPMTEVGLLIYVMVDSVADTIEKVTAAGGGIVPLIAGGGPQITHTFLNYSGQ